MREFPVGRYLLTALLMFPVVTIYYENVTEPFAWPWIVATAVMAFGSAYVLYWVAGRLLRYRSR